MNVQSKFCVTSSFQLIIIIILLPFIYCLMLQWFFSLTACCYLLFALYYADQQYWSNIKIFWNSECKAYLELLLGQQEEMVHTPQAQPIMIVVIICLNVKPFTICQLTITCTAVWVILPETSGFSHIYDHAIAKARHFFRNLCWYSQKRI